MPAGTLSRNSTSSPRDPPRTPLRTRKTRTRTSIACDTCRARRTRCDSRRPLCTYCRSHGIDCQYQDNPAEAPSKVELELATINKRLDQLTNLVNAICSNVGVIQSPSSVVTPHEGRDIFSEEEQAPFKLLGSRSMMDVLDLEPDFMNKLAVLEREPTPGIARAAHRFCIVQSEQAISALAAFSDRIHVWYPIFRFGFSERYLRIISGPLVPSTESSLVLLVAAIGILCQQHALCLSQSERGDISFSEAALSSMPIIIEELSLNSIQCLILLSIYNCCLLKPCQAHEFCLIASFKVQNLFKSIDMVDAETRASLSQAYWAILLLESELSNQFDFPKSGIWILDEHVGLPDSQETWQCELAGSPTPNNSLSPTGHPLRTNTGIDVVDAYFLAEISMRRMLHRCNTAIRRDRAGSTVYAPRIASELTRQLDEWHTYLPNSIRFDPTEYASHERCPLINFLHVQYHCYRIATYWPAAYQAIRDGSTDPELLEDCRALLSAYIVCIPSLMEALRNCMVNRWTLFATLFMSSMAVLKVVNTPWLQATCTPQLFQTLGSAASWDSDWVRQSPSLHHMDKTLKSRLSATYETFEEGTAMAQSV